VFKNRRTAAALEGSPAHRLEIFCVLESSPIVFTYPKYRFGKYPAKMQALNNRPANVLAVPKWTVIIHGVQMLLAIIILGLDAYGIRWIPYNALIFSLVAVSQSLTNTLTVLF
jgi:hypothetical protein